jgi:hypothetical protein
MKKAKRTKQGDLRASYTREDFPKELARGTYAARFAAESNIDRLDPAIGGRERVKKRAPR